MKNSKYSLVHYGPIKYSNNLNNLIRERNKIKKSGQFELDGQTYKLYTPLRIFNLKEDVEVFK